MSDKPHTIQLAARMGLLPDYMFAKLNALRQAKRQAGMDLIDMAMGNPKDPTPQPIVDKLTEVVQDARNHRYSVASGIYNLRNELAKYYQAQYGVGLNPEEEVIFTIGSKEGFSHLCLALIGPGDKAMIPSPSFPIHSYAVILAGGETVSLPVMDDEAFLRGIDDACSKIHPPPKVLFMNYPHNPTGKTVEIAFFNEVVKLARKHNLIVVHDFAYSRLSYDGFEAPSFLQAEGAKEVGVEFGTMSKAFNMAGWRIGYALGNKDIIKALARIKGYYDYGIFQAIQIASIIALRECQDYVVKQVEIYQKRRDVVLAGLRSAGWEVETPKGGMFVWVKIPQPWAQEGSTNFALRLIEEAELVASPGAGFGPEGEGWLRMAFVENEQRLKQAMRNLKQAFNVPGGLKKAQGQ
ncbi:MAG: aminotransferase class I/II-fold pyridoxal phosphate-dependent enzyme [Deltaproteobacteria bacterium]|nr:aminotransferase class I/II-fold pyridoxal phosphate-dependent enzyme [Deltaproteobacteria bacterium]